MSDEFVGEHLKGLSRRLQFEAFLSDTQYKQNEQTIKSDDLGLQKFWSNYLHWQGDIKVLKIIIEEADADEIER